jgi:hypothetical protein
MVLVSTTNGIYPAEVEQTLDDNTVLIYFWNGQGGPVRAKATIYPAYLEPSAKLKEVYTYSPSAEQSIRPIWDITPVTNIVGEPLMPEIKGGKRYLPIVTQQVTTEFLKSKTSKGKGQKK